MKYMIGWGFKENKLLVKGKGGGVVNLLLFFKENKTKQVPEHLQS